jgi:hypothetical protein
MSTERKVKVVPADSFPLGHEKENKDASSWAFKFPQSSGTDSDIGVFAQPVITSLPPAGENGGLEKDVKTSGIKMRGVGAATKGVMSRGSMS